MDDDDEGNPAPSGEPEPLGTTDAVSRPDFV